MTMKFKALALLTSVVLYGCGGGSESSQSGGLPTTPTTPTTPAPPPEPEAVSIDAVSISHADMDLIEMDSGFVVESGELRGETFSFSAQLNVDEESVSCFLDDKIMPKSGATYSIDIKPSYLTQVHTLSCARAEEEADVKALEVRAVKSDVEQLFQSFLADLPEYPLNNNNAEEIERSQLNFYYEINNLLSASRVYTQPSDFGIAPNDPVIDKIESYLINAAEMYFQPCFNYDFYEGAPASCRSEEKVDGYYLWRSPQTNREGVRTFHAKVEWRSAAGIAQGIKAILNKHVNNDEVCLVDDLPSRVRAQSLSCRAKNIRRMIKEQVLDKWDYALHVSDVVHYEAWIELIYDMYSSTQDIAHNYECTENCYSPPTVESIMDKLLSYVVDEGDHLNITCRPSTHAEQRCAWWFWELGKSNSNDLSHLALLMHVFELTGKNQVCSSDGENCFDRTKLIKTLKERTWVTDIEDSNGYLFPKFDIFLNGYCRDNFNNPDSELQDYCHDFWFTESRVNNSHRQLYGFVNWGAYDAELMDILLVAADTNRDGLINDDDILVKDYIAMLYLALNAPRQ